MIIAAQKYLENAIINWREGSCRGELCEGFHGGSESSWVWKNEQDFAWQTSWDILGRENSVGKGRGMKAY